MAESEIKISGRVLRKRNKNAASDQRLCEDDLLKEETKRPKYDNTTDLMRPNYFDRLLVTHYDKSGIDLARYLLGKRICRVLDNGTSLAGRIVETEAYLGETDRACHTFGGKRTQRTEPMYMTPGTSYVYFIYGMYFCLNISSRDTGGCVLVRALEPLQGQDEMRKLRSEKRKSGSKSTIKDHSLCNGPSKLCTSLGITKENLNKEHMPVSSKLWIEKDIADKQDFTVVVSKRVGIDSYGVDCSSKPYRFYILGNKCVSIRDKDAEKVSKTS